MSARQCGGRWEVAASGLNAGTHSGTSGVNVKLCNVLYELPWDALHRRTSTLVSKEVEEDV